MHLLNEEEKMKNRCVLFVFIFSFLLTLVNCRTIIKEDNLGNPINCIPGETKCIKDKNMICLRITGECRGHPKEVCVIYKDKEKTECEMSEYVCSYKTKTDCNPSPQGIPCPEFEKIFKYCECDLSQKEATGGYGQKYIAGPYDCIAHHTLDIFIEYDPAPGYEVCK